MTENINTQPAHQPNVLYSAYWACLAFCSITLTLAMMVTNPIRFQYGIIFFIVLGVISESTIIQIVKCDVSLTSAIILSTMLVYGPSHALIVYLAAFLLSVSKKEDGGKRHLFNTPIKKMLTNFFVLTISTSLGLTVYMAVGGPFGMAFLPRDKQNFHNLLLLIGEGIFPIIIFILVDFFANTILISVNFYLQSKQNILQSMSTEFLWSLSGILLVGFFGAIIAAVYIPYGWFAASAVAIPIGMIYYLLDQNTKARKSTLGMVMAMVEALDAKDRYTSGHSKRVQGYSVAIGEHMRISRKQLEQLKTAAILHDIGKIGIPDEVLNKVGKLTNPEFDTIKEHPERGAAILKKVEPFKQISDIVKYHHSHFSGGGYPQTNGGESTPLLSRIITVADSYDAMTSNRSYRRALEHQFAIDELKKCSGTQFDPSVVDAFCQVMSNEKEKSKLMINVESILNNIA